MPGGYAIFVDQIPPTGVPAPETVWRAEETGIDIAAGTSYSRAFDTGTSPAGMGTGRYEVFSALRSPAGKDLAAAYASFIVAPEEGYVSVTTDKTHYRAGEEMLIEATACNVSGQSREYTLELRLGNELIDRRTKVIAGRDSYTYSVEYRAPEHAAVLCLENGYMSACRDLHVAAPELTAGIFAPGYYALGKQISLNVSLANTGNIDLEGAIKVLRYPAGAEDNTVTVYEEDIEIPAAEAKQVEIFDTIASGENVWKYRLEIYHGGELLAEKESGAVEPGNKIAFRKVAEEEFVEGNITLPVTVINEGNLPVENMEVAVSMENSALAEPLAQTIAVPWIAAARDGEPGSATLEFVFEEVPGGSYSVQVTGNYTGSMEIGTVVVRGLEAVWETEVVESPEAVNAGESAEVTFAVTNLGLVPGEVRIIPLSEGEES